MSFKQLLRKMLGYASLTQPMRAATELKNPLKSRLVVNSTQKTKPHQ